MAVNVLSRAPSFPYYKPRVADHLVQVVSMVRSMGIASVVCVATTHCNKWQVTYVVCVHHVCLNCH